MCLSTQSLHCSPAFYSPNVDSDPAARLSIHESSASIMFALFDSPAIWNNLVMPIHHVGRGVAYPRGMPEFLARNRYDNGTQIIVVPPVPPSLALSLSSVVLHEAEMPAS